MRECRTSGSVRGVPSNGHPYRNPDAYCCPAGELLTRRFTCVEKGLTLHSYWYHVGAFDAASSISRIAPAEKQSIVGHHR
jgi:hypothetical protein